MDASMIYRDIRPFLQEDGRLTALPVKRRKQLTALYYLSTKFESGRTYTEGEVNDLLDDWTTFHDPATLRRELFNKYLLNRANDCSRYWKEADIPALEAFLAKNL